MQRQLYGCVWLLLPVAGRLPSRTAPSSQKQWGHVRTHCLVQCTLCLVPICRYVQHTATHTLYLRFVIFSPVACFVDHGAVRPEKRLGERSAKKNATDNVPATMRSPQPKAEDAELQQFCVLTFLQQGQHKIFTNNFGYQNIREKI